MNAPTARQIGEYIAGLETENQKLRTRIERSVDAKKFYAVRMGLPEVARLHGVDARTVRYYVKAGRIESHPDSTSARMYIRGSVALTLDFKNLRKISYRAR